MVTEEEHDLAEEEGRRIQESGLYAVAAHYDPSTRLMHVTLKRGFTISFHKERSQVMATASDEDLSDVDVSPPGWSIVFPRLDDGFTIEGLLAGRFGTAKWEREWADKHRTVAA